MSGPFCARAHDQSLATMSRTPLITRTQHGQHQRATRETITTNTITLTAQGLPRGNVQPGKSTGGKTRGTTTTKDEQPSSLRKFVFSVLGPGALFGADTALMPHNRYIWKCFRKCLEQIQH